MPSRTSRGRAAVTGPHPRGDLQAGEVAAGEVAAEDNQAGDNQAGDGHVGDRGRSAVAGSPLWVCSGQSLAEGPASRWDSPPFAATCSPISRRRVR